MAALTQNVSNRADDKEEEKYFVPKRIKYYWGWNKAKVEVPYLEAVSNQL